MFFAEYDISAQLTSIVKLKRNVLKCTITDSVVTHTIFSVKWLMCSVHI